MSEPIRINERNAAEVARNVKHGAMESAGTVRRSPSITALAVAMAKAQAEMKNPPKDSVNPHFKNRYADLATVRASVVPVMLSHGLTVMQFPCDLDDAPALTTLLVHSSGEWVETTMRLRPTKADPQGVGSALTYLRRYSLLAITGLVADDDDDGNAASRPTQQAPAQQHAKPAPASFQDLMRAVVSARDEAALRAAFGDAYKAHESQRISDQQFADITTAKDEKKKQFTKAPA